MIIQKMEDGKSRGDERADGPGEKTEATGLNEHEDATEASLGARVMKRLLALMPEVFLRENNEKDNQLKFLAATEALEQTYKLTMQKNGNKDNNLTICKLKLESLGNSGIARFIETCLENQESIVLIPDLNDKTVEFLSSSGTSRTYSFENLEDSNSPLLLVFFRTLTVNGGKVLIKLDQDFQGYLSEDHLVAIAEKSRPEKARPTSRSKGEQQLSP